MSQKEPTVVIRDAAGNIIPDPNMPQHKPRLGDPAMNALEIRRTNKPAHARFEIWVPYSLLAMTPGDLLADLQATSPLQFIQGLYSLIRQALRAGQLASADVHKVSAQSAENGERAP